MSPKKLSRVTVLMERADFERFDAYCEAHGFKKSTLIARLLREHLDAVKFQVRRPLPPPASQQGGSR